MLVSNKIHLMGSYRIIFNVKKLLFEILPDNNILLSSFGCMLDIDSFKNDYLIYKCLFSVCCKVVLNWTLP